MSLARALARGAALAAGLALAAPAGAACTSALQLGTCSATVSATALSFGNYNPSSGSASDVTSVVTVTGTVFGVTLFTTLSYTISLSAGVTGTVADRRLTGGSGGPSLAYNLYTTTGRDTVWGVDGVSDSMTALAVVLGATLSRPYTVYGRIPAGQFVSPGSNYTDTVTVTVSY